MIFKGSRYSHVEVITPLAPNGDTPEVLALRVIEARASTFRYVVSEGDRLDQLAARFYGDPTKYWLILDANPDTLNPFDLLQPGIAINVPQNELIGQ